MKLRVKLIIGIVSILALSITTYYAYNVIKEQTMKENKKLIPRKVLFGNPDKITVRLSPDGRYISFVAPLNGVLNVWVAPRDDINAAKPVTRDTGRGVRNYFWSYLPNILLYIQDKDGDENWHIYKRNINDDAVVDLTPFKGVHAQVLKLSDKFPEQMLISLNNRSPEFHDIHKVNLKDNSRELIEENNEYAGFLADDQLNIRLATKLTPDGGSSFLLKQDKGYKELLRANPDDMINTQPLTFDKAGKKLYITDCQGRNTSALVEIDLATGSKTVIASDEKSDLDDVIFHPTENYPQAFATNYERKAWQLLDPQLKKDFDYIKGLEDGDAELASRTYDDKFWIVAFLKDTGPIRYYLYDREQTKAHFLFTSNKSLENLPLVPMVPKIIKTRDGFEMVCFLSVPDKAGPVPLILNVHGGPTVRDDWGYDPLHQWLANRGYAVLSVNYRGSTGFGKKFLTAGYGEWAAKAHDDLIDAVNWAVENGIADKSKVAILGGSYGGYAALVGLTFTPEVFACAVDIVGPSNLITLFESIPAYWKPARDMLRVRIGASPDTEEGREFLRSRSPLTFVDKICRPLLIGQGANDPRVKQAESDQIVEAMRAKNLPVTYILYPDEGHGFARPENRISFFAETEKFLAEFLGGDFEEVGDDFAGSSIQVVPAQGVKK